MAFNATAFNLKFRQTSWSEILSITEKKTSVKERISD